MSEIQSRGQGRPLNLGESLPPPPNTTWELDVPVLMLMGLFSFLFCPNSATAFV